MYKVILCSIVLVMALAACNLLSSCQPARIIVLDSEGIISYNKRDGIFEMLWQTKAKAHASETDTIPSQPKHSR